MIVILDLKTVVRKENCEIPDIAVRDIGEYVSLISKNRVSTVKKYDAMNRLINDLCPPY